MAAKGSAVIDTSAVMGNILVIRGHRVLLDSDLAALYQVETKAELKRRGTGISVIPTLSAAMAIACGRTRTHCCPWQPGGF